MPTSKNFKGVIGCPNKCGKTFILRGKVFKLKSKTLELKRRMAEHLTSCGGAFPLPQKYQAILQTMRNNMRKK